MSAAPATRTQTTAEIVPFQLRPAPGQWHPHIRALYGYWQSKLPAPDAAGCRLPGRQHLDPVEIPTLLPWLWLIDVQREPPRFRFRLFGTKHYEQMHCDPTGRWCDEAFPSFVSQPTYPDYLKVGLDGLVSYRKGPPAYHVDSECRLLERIMLPLARDGRTVDMILALTLYFRADQALY
ncbi:PAS domain-containing protein [Tistlia consotensis]|uniref:PAS domain-containing protein n=1 Tax=Tistlia consotensis USBA 355 TaxID=560819 RepID=A0A1Y6CTA7_9PROT|nr:PAS domain-containing protein [Tistlia consotensis]SMF72642.1 PAS domain-containing protein [Tistlia consotensis USBA 355]SNS09598.1 PAS domain-containing protein [Tistlia consotensis]